MEKIVRFKRNWEESFIRVCVCEGDRVEIDAPLYLFQKRLGELLEVPNIRFKSKAKMRELLVNAFKDAFDKTAKELKDETVGV
jgi:hypothetical protein